LSGQVETSLAIFRILTMKLEDEMDEYPEKV